MAEDPSVAGPENVPEEMAAELTTEDAEVVAASSDEMPSEMSSMDVPEEESSSELPSEETEVATVSDAEMSRGMRLLRRLALLFFVAWAGVEISSPLCSGYSLGALEKAFSSSGKKGLTLEAAQGHVVGLAMMSFREEQMTDPKRRSVHFAVFSWPSAFSFFRNNSFEVEIEKVKSSNAKKAVILVRSQPYIFQPKIDYPVVQPLVVPDPPLMQLMMLDHEPDSKGNHRVERWQVERAIKNKKYKPSLLVYFDENDKNGDGVVTAGELGQQVGIEPVEDESPKPKSGR